MTASQRYKLTLAYRGTNYHGWQSQAVTENYKEEVPEGQGIPTIQETLSRAVESVVRHPVKIVGSSRTDAGVHAKGQIAHFDTEAIQIPREGMRRAINAALPTENASGPISAGVDCSGTQTVHVLLLESGQ